MTEAAMRMATSVTVRTLAMTVALGLVVMSCAASASPDPNAIKGTFDLGGRSLYLECVGVGGATIVMDAGLGNSHTTWAQVVPGVRDSNRICTYDRANIGASDKASVPRTSADVVADLHQLLAAAKVTGPLLLVGHSFAGISMRLFAATYPADVIGLVLVDPTLPTFIDDECSLVDPTLCATLRAESAPSKNPDGLDIAGSAEELAAAPPLPTVPLLVLAATTHHQPAITDAAIESQIEALWQRRLSEVASSVPGGKVEVVSSGHDIQSLHPDAVVAAIKSVLADVPKAS
jgi:pimeloyl-ACP methyl ester carboxylesterase